MIWRGRYRDHIIENPDLPPLKAFRLADQASLIFPVLGVTLGAFSVSGATELAMWRKLIGADLGFASVSLWLGTDEGFVAAATPDSLWEVTYLSSDDGWSVSLGREEAEHSFAVLTNPEGVRLAFLGLPTEDGLDRVSAFLRR